MDISQMQEENLVQGIWKALKFEIFVGDLIFYLHKQWTQRQEAKYIKRVLCLRHRSYYNFKLHSAYTKTSKT